MASRRARRAAQAAASRATPTPTPARERERGRPASRHAYFDRDAADHVCEFFESMLILGEGEWQGQPLKLMPWQRDHLLRPLFGWKDERTGLRWYRRADVWAARKIAKTTTLAGVAIYLAMCDGELAANVYLCANDKVQAGDTVFRVVKQFVEANPLLASCTEVFDSVRTKAVFVPGTASKIEALSSKTKNKDGLNPHGVIFDELHEFDDEEFFAKLTTGSGVRQQPLTLVISTPGRSKATLGYRQYELSKRILEGRSNIEDRLVLIYEPGPDDDWREESTWKKANPAYGITVKPREYRSMLAEALEDAANELAFRRYMCAQWIDESTGWIREAVWDRCAGRLDDDQTLAKLDCYLGVDLSKRDDLTAVAAVFVEPGQDPSVVEDRRYQVLVHCFVPEENIEVKERRDGVPYRLWAKQGYVTLTPGDVIDVGSVRNYIAAMGRQYKVVEVCYDAWNAQTLVSELAAADMQCVEVLQQPKVVCPATAAYKTAVLQGRLRHAGNPLLRHQLSNVRVIIDINGNERISKKHSTARIDAHAAIVTAMVRASVLGEGPSIWDNRSLWGLDEGGENGARG